MHLFIKTAVFAAISGFSLSAIATQQPLQYEDVFQLEFVSDPQISSNGDQVVFVRNRFDQDTG